MNSTKWLGIGAAIVLVIASFFPLVTLPKFGTMTGFHAPEEIGKPAIFHLFFIFIFVLGYLINRVWSLYMSVVVSALNIAWAIRTFYFSSCQGGICPDKHSALYVILIASILMLIAVSFTKVKTNSPEGNTQ